MARRGASLCIADRDGPHAGGNKRTAYVCMRLFLALNGMTLNAEKQEKIQIVLKLAAGKMGRAALSKWMQSHVVPR